MNGYDIGCDIGLVNINVLNSSYDTVHKSLRSYHGLRDRSIYRPRCVRVYLVH